MIFATIHTHPATANTSDSAFNVDAVCLYKYHTHAFFPSHGSPSTSVSIPVGTCKLCCYSQGFHDVPVIPVPVQLVPAMNTTFTQHCNLIKNY